MHSHHEKTRLASDPSPGALNEDLRRWGQASSWWRVWHTMQLLKASPDPRAELRRLVPECTHPDVSRGRVCPLLVDYVEGLVLLREIDARAASRAPASALN
jgi:hypothetical protein